MCTGTYSRQIRVWRRKWNHGERIAPEGWELNNNSSLLCLFRDFISTHLSLFGILWVKRVIVIRCGFVDITSSPWILHYLKVAIKLIIFGYKSMYIIQRYTCSFLFSGSKQTGQTGWFRSKLQYAIVGCHRLNKTTGIERSFHSIFLLQNETQTIIILWKCEFFFILQLFCFT